MRHTKNRALFVLMLIVGILLFGQSPAPAHHEREPVMPDGTGSVPAYRAAGPEILVCKTDRQDFARRVVGFPGSIYADNLSLFDRCQMDGVRHVQDAIQAARLPGTRIRILPGVYYEEPSLASASPACTGLASEPVDAEKQLLSWDQQVACPHVQNLLAVIGKSQLQIEGTGATPGDVVIDAQYRKLNALRADRSNGIYLRNMTIQRTKFNAVYIMETDGFVVDHVVARWNNGYGFLNFATDHGLYTDCEAYGNGEAGLYPGANSDINKGRKWDVDRYAIEVRRCRSHHNLLGYSGTAGNSVWVHDSEFDANTAGVSMDSLFRDHPGLPQNHSRFERNDIHDNNEDYYRYLRDGSCRTGSPERGYERGVVCPLAGVPRGTGVITAGGNFNLFRDNWIYGQDNAAFVLFWVPAQVRGGDRSATFDTSHHNIYVANHLGRSPSGQHRPNQLDVWWDGQGDGNRWEAARTEPYNVPGMRGPSTHRLISDPYKLLKLAQCHRFDAEAQRIPFGCNWYGGAWFTQIDVIAAAMMSLLLATGALLLLWRRLPRRRLSLLATASGLSGAAGYAAGVALEGTATAALAAVLLAAWWTLAGALLWREGRRRVLAATTLALGGLAVMEAIDRGLFMIPFLPLSPGWAILVVGFAWVLAT